MKAETAALLLFADATIPGGREALLEDLVPLLADRRFYSMAEVAKRYSVSERAVKGWRQEGKLIPSLKIPGGTVRFSLADLLKFETETGRKEAERA